MLIMNCLVLQNDERTSSSVGIRGVLVAKMNMRLLNEC